MDETGSVFAAQRERRLLFRGREIATADLADGMGYVSVRSLCEAFGIDPNPQRRRLQRNQSYFGPYTATILMKTRGGPQPTLCIAAPFVPLFLTGVDLERIADEEARAYLRAFLDEAAEVLADHFGVSERGELRVLRETINRVIAQQEEYEGRIKKAEEEVVALHEGHEAKVSQIREAFAELRQSVRSMEAIAGPKNRLTPEQRGEIRSVVATLGHLLVEHKGIASPYAGIYLDICRMTGVSEVKDIAQGDFPRVIAFLNQRIQAVQASAEGSGEG